MLSKNNFLSDIKIKTNHENEWIKNIFNCKSEILMGLLMFSKD